MRLKDKIKEIIKESDRPLTREEVADALGIRGKERKAVFKALKSMEKEGLIYKNRKDKYKDVNGDNIFEGKIDMAEKGFAFAVIEDREDIFISPDDLNSAMNGDTVIVKIKEKTHGEKRDEGYVDKILKRGITQLVGTLTIKNKDEFGFVIADDKDVHYDIFVREEDFNGGENGQKVLVKLTKYPEGKKNPEGKVKEVLGFPGEKGIDVLAIAYNHGIRMEFPKKVLNEARSLPIMVRPEDMEGRVDLRDELLFTIDGADAKDLDDAISISKLDNGNYKLGVHIADVAHYVRENSPLDKEALKRGNSVYLIDRVIPMLPKELSNGICSLYPDVDRLAMTVYMEIDKEGKVQKSEIFESVIRSKARLIYKDVSDYLEDDSEEAKKILGPDITAQLDIMKELMEILHEKRHEKGAIDFNFAEGVIVVDEDGYAIDVKKADRRIGDRLIEEFMLVTNETVSETYYWADLPFLYRIHEYPDEDKIAIFLNFIRGLGYSVKGRQDEIHPRELQGIIEEISGKKEEAVVNRMMLRSLKKAKYSEINDIHFGLSSQYYSHFTAPIRRYPDLQIHRIIKENLNGKLSPKRIDYYERILPEVADTTSQTERVAEEAERDVEKIKKAEYMENHIGEVHEGLISGVTSFGIFVELENTIEGLVSYNTMEDDYYIYDEERMMAKGEKYKKEYQLGDRVTIEVIHAEKERGIIDFKFVSGDINGEKAERQ